MYWKPNEFFDETFDWIILVDADDNFDKNFLNVYNGDRLAGITPEGLASVPVR